VTPDQAKKVATVIALALGAVGLIGWAAATQRDTYDNAIRLGANCADGHFTEATGSGACSGHGGVETWRILVPSSADSASYETDLGPVPGWARRGTIVDPFAAAPWAWIGAGVATGIWGQRWLAAWASSPQ
jgi:hypothetical protein